MRLKFIVIGILLLNFWMASTTHAQEKGSEDSILVSIEKTAQKWSKEFTCFLNSFSGQEKNAKAVKETYVKHKHQKPQAKKTTKTKEVAVSQKEAKNKKYDHIIKEASHLNGVDPYLAKAVTSTESGFDPRAVSKKGAQGLMQLMPDTSKSLGVKNPFNPEENIHAGVKYLAENLKKFDGNISLALAAYNAGPTKVASLGKIPNNPETREFVRTVLARYKRYKNQG